MLPSARVFDLFAVPGVVEPLPGGQGRSVRAGDLVLSPGRDAATQDWLSPLVARLAVRLDQDPGRRRQDLRIAVPVPARDGSWVVEGWAASRYEPGTVTCRELRVVRAAGHLLHARLATAVPRCPPQLAARTGRRARAERIAFGEAPPPRLAPKVADLLARARAATGGELPAGPAQLVHADLAGNVLLDAAGAPVVIDVAPAWRPARWADAVCVLDSVLWHGAPRASLDVWAHGPDRVAMLHAIMFRLLSAPGTADDGTADDGTADDGTADDGTGLDAYAGALSSVTTT